MEDDGLVESNDTASLARNGVKAFHFVAYRKPGLDIVWDSYVGPGGSLAAARRTFANLPHDEPGYKKLTGFKGADEDEAEGSGEGGVEEDDGGVFDPEAVAAVEAEKKSGAGKGKKGKAATLRRRIALR